MMPGALTAKEAAAWWAMRLDTGACSPAEKAAFEAWRQESATHAEAFARAERALAAVDAHALHPEVIALGEEVVDATANAGRVRTRRFALAAGVLAFAAGIAAVSSFRTSVGPPTDTYETQTGQRSSISLADSSSVTLNTRSHLEVTLSPALREVRLLRGQAWFEVAKDPARPFVVLAGDRRIMAIGTAFDVRIDAQDRVQVTVAEGRVRVDGIEPRPQDRLDLTPGQKLVAAPGRSAAVAQADVERLTIWREGRLVFRGERLEDVVAEMNRYSLTQLEVADEAALRNLAISGVFETGKTASFLLALKARHGLSTRPLSDDRVLIVR